MLNTVYDSLVSNYFILKAINISRMSHVHVLKAIANHQTGFMLIVVESGIKILKTAITSQNRIV